MTETKKSVQEARDLVTGFDEIAVEKQFGKHIDDMRGADILRSLIWLDSKRAGEDARAAYTSVMGLSQTGITDCFTDESEDDAGEDADNEFTVTEVGKDVTPATSPTSRPPHGASSVDSPLVSI